LWLREGTSGLPSIRAQGVDQDDYTTWKLPNARYCTLSPSTRDQPTDLGCRWDFSKFMDREELKRQAMTLYRALAPCFKARFERLQYEQVQEEYGSGSVGALSADGKHLFSLRVSTLSVPGQRPHIDVDFSVNLMK